MIISQRKFFFNFYNKYCGIEKGYLRKKILKVKKKETEKVNRKKKREKSESR